MNIRAKKSLILSSLLMMSLQGCGFGSFPIAYDYSTYSDPYYDYDVSATPSPYELVSPAPYPAESASPYYVYINLTPSPEPSQAPVIVRPKKITEYCERVEENDYSEEVVTEEEQDYVEKIKVPVDKKKKHVKAKDKKPVVIEEVTDDKEYLLCEKETILDAKGKPVSQVTCQPIEEDTDEI